MVFASLTKISVRVLRIAENVLVLVKKNLAGNGSA